MAISSRLLLHPITATEPWPTCSYRSDRLDGDPAEAVDLYTRQSSLSVTTLDLAVMGATLANGGVNPTTGERVVSALSLPPRACRHGNGGTV